MHQNKQQSFYCCLPNKCRAPGKMCTLSGDSVPTLGFVNLCLYEHVARSMLQNVSKQYRSIMATTCLLSGCLQILLQFSWFSVPVVTSRDSTLKQTEFSYYSGSLGLRFWSCGPAILSHVFQRFSQLLELLVRDFKI